MPAKHTPEERFESKIERMPNGCWVWQVGCFNDGYGSFWVHGRSRRAHRWAWEQAHGRPVPPESLVCHTCDNPLCVNPEHLFVGSQLDNMQDARAKGRKYDNHTRGRKLTAKEVTAIRAEVASGRTRKDVAEERRLAYSTVKRIVSRRLWPHI